MKKSGVVIVILRWQTRRGVNLITICLSWPALFRSKR